MTRSPVARTTLALVLLFCTRQLAAQEAGLGLPGKKSELSVRLLGGSLLTRVQLRAGEKTTPAHLVVDLGRRDALLLHGNTARLLAVGNGGRVALSAAGVELEGLEVRVDGLRALERLTMEYARELEDIPAVGYLGLAAFANRRLLLDPEAGTLRLLGARTLEATAPSERTPPRRVPLAVKDGVYRLSVDFEDGSKGWATLDTSGPDSWSNRDRPALESGDRSRVPSIVLDGINISDYTAFRTGPYPEERAGDPDVVLGSGFLSHFSLMLDPHNRVMDLVPQRPPAFPEADFQAVAALASVDWPVIESFLRQHIDHRLAPQVAQRLLEMRVVERPRSVEKVKQALGWRARSAPVKRRARVILGLLDGLKKEAPFAFDEVRELALAQALEAARADTDTTALPKVQSEIGEVLLDAGDLKGAYRHLLSAAFQLPRDGPINLRLGRLYEARGKWERAWSRYLQAAITDDAGPDGLDALKRLARQRKLTTPFDVDQMERALEGRVPAFEPAGSYTPQKGQAVTRRCLVEVFTGAQNEGSAAAVLAADGVRSFFGDRYLVLLEHHLHAGGLDPMASPASNRRARAAEVESVPTVLVDGHSRVDGVSGAPEKAGDVYLRVKKRIRERLEIPTPWKLALAGVLDQRSLGITATAEGPEEAGVRLHVHLCERTVLFPGSSRIVFHRFVNRGELNPGGTVLERTPGKRTLQLKVDLNAVSSSLAQYLDRVEAEAGRSFTMRATTIDARQVAVVAYIATSSGRVLQAALWEASRTGGR